MAVRDTAHRPLSLPPSPPPGRSDCARAAAGGATAVSGVARPARPPPPHTRYVLGTVVVLIFEFVAGTGCGLVLSRDISSCMHVHHEKPSSSFTFAEFEDEVNSVLLESNSASSNFRFLSENTPACSVENQDWTNSVVVSQTHWLVSQERLSPRAGTSVFIDLPITPSGEQWF